MLNFACALKCVRNTKSTVYIRKRNSVNLAPTSLPTYLSRHFVNTTDVLHAVPSGMVGEAEYPCSLGIQLGAARAHNGGKLTHPDLLFVKATREFREGNGLVSGSGD